MIIFFQIMIATVLANTIPEFSDEQVSQIESKSR